jgi:ribosomal protein S18 acetylase RimI-like enzyme
MTTIRLALQDEIPRAVDAWRAANGGHETPGHAERLQSWAAEEGAALLLAPEANYVAGMVLCLPGRAGDGSGPPVPGQLHVTGLAVRPERQRHGLGGALLDAALAEAHRRHCPRVTLWTHASNLAAQRMFERRGFKASGRTAPDTRGNMMVHFERKEP